MSSANPDWVMCGMRLATGGVRLLASKELTLAELEVMVERQDIFWAPGDILPVAQAVTSQRMTLTTHMRTFVVIDAPDYPSAFSDLFRDWSPEGDVRLAITTGQGELTP
jgi:hypothetical protein